VTVYMKRLPIGFAYLVAGCYALGEHYYAKGNA